MIRFARCFRGGLLLLSLCAAASAVLAADGETGAVEGSAHDVDRRTAMEARPDGFLLRRCMRGDGDACAAGAARLLSRGAEAAIGRRNGEWFLREACRAGNREGCNALLIRRASRTLEPPEGHAALAEACVVGDGSSCTALAALLRGNRMRAWDTHRAALAADRACLLGDGPGCALLSEMLSDCEGHVPGSHFTDDEARDRACELGEARACAAGDGQLGLGAAQGTMDRDQVTRIMRRHASPRLLRILNWAIRSGHMQREQEGLIVWGVFINEDGENIEVHLACDLLGRAEVAERQAEVFRGLDFPAPVGGSVYLRYPVHFRVAPE